MPPPDFVTDSALDNLAAALPELGLSTGDVPVRPATSADYDWLGPGFAGRRGLGRGPFELGMYSHRAIAAALSHDAAEGEGRFSRALDPHAVRDALLVAAQFMGGWVDRPSDEETGVLVDHRAGDRDVDSDEEARDTDYGVPVVDDDGNDSSSSASVQGDDADEFERERRRLLPMCVRALASAPVQLAALQFLRDCWIPLFAGGRPVGEDLVLSIVERLRAMAAEDSISDYVGVSDDDDGDGDGDGDVPGGNNGNSNNNNNSNGNGNGSGRPGRVPQQMRCAFSEDQLHESLDLSPECKARWSPAQHVDFFVRQAAGYLNMAGVRLPFALRSPHDREQGSENDHHYDNDVYKLCLGTLAAYVSLFRSAAMPRDLLSSLHALRQHSREEFWRGLRFRQYSTRNRRRNHSRRRRPRYARGFAGHKIWAALNHIEGCEAEPSTGYSVFETYRAGPVPLPASGDGVGTAPLLQAMLGREIELARALAGEHRLRNADVSAISEEYCEWLRPIWALVGPPRGLNWNLRAQGHFRPRRGGRSGWYGYEVGDDGDE